MKLNRTILKVVALTTLVSAAPLAAARPATFLPTEQEVIAIGDLHGDYSAMVKILRAAKLIDRSNNWIGGSKTLVQVGDQLDRGDTEKEILDLFERLISQANQAGGQVIVLNGNHETMNVELDFRYVTSGGFRQFQSYYNSNNSDSDVRRLPSEQRGRAVAFKPGGPYAKVLAEHNSVVMIGKTVFVHGGITPQHAEYGLDNINEEISDWMKGYAREPWSVGGSGPLWNRDYGQDVSSGDCSQLNETLNILNADRMVIAHTRQRSINQTCSGKVWRVDVAMASYYGGKLQALKITNDDLIQIIEESGAITDTGYGNGNGGNDGDSGGDNGGSNDAQCPSGFSEYTGTIGSDGTESIVSNGYYYSSDSGTHSMKNMGEPIDMRFYKWKNSQWELKKQSQSELSYTSTAGYYYPYLVGTAGTPYKVCLKHP